MRERSKRPNRAYAAIPNAAMRDENISMEARGLLALLMTYSDDWTFRKDKLMEVTGWGRDKLEKHMGELRRAQYVELVQDRDKTGRVHGSTWIIRDEGHRGPENQCVGDATEALNFSDTEALKNQHPVKPSPGKSAPIRRTILKENQKEESQGGFDESEISLFPDLPKPEAPLGGKTPDQWFDDFWAAYPTKPGTSKKNAKAKFIAALKLAKPEDLIRAASAYAKSRDREDPKFTKHAEFWLSGQFWETWLAEPEIDPERARLQAITAAARAAGRPQIGRL